MNRIRRDAVVVLLVSAFLLPACNPLLGLLADRDRKTRMRLLTTIVALETVGRLRNQVFGIQSRNREGTGYGFQPIPCLLYGAFAYQVTVGALVPGSRLPSTGFACTEVDQFGAAPLIFYALCAQYTGGGMNVWAARDGDSNLGAHFFPGVDRIVLSMVVVAGVLHYYARTVQAAAWILIASTAVTNALAAHFPSVGAAQMDRGSSVAFDNFEVTANEPPEPSSTEEAALARVQCAQAALNSAQQRLDGGREVDRPAAAQSLGEAEECIEDALDELAGLPASRTRDRAEKKLEAALRDIGHALERLDDPRQVRRAGGAVRSAQRNVDRATGSVGLLQVQ